MTDALKEVNMNSILLVLILMMDFVGYCNFFPLCITLPCQALAELYVIDGQYEKDFALYADVSALDEFRQNMVHAETQPLLKEVALYQMHSLDDL